MARRRHFLIGVTTASTVAIAGCSDTDLGELEGGGGNTSNKSADDQTDEIQESNNEEKEENEDADEQTGPEAAVEQFFNAFYADNLDRTNAVIYEDGELLRNGQYENLPDYQRELLQLDTEEITSDEYQTELGQPFNETAEAERLAETGGSDYALVSTTAIANTNTSVPREREIIYIVHKINNEWLLVDIRGVSDEVAVDELDDLSPPFGDGPTGAVKKYWNAFDEQDADAVNDVLYSESPQLPVEESDLEGDFSVAGVSTSEVSAEIAAGVAGSEDADSLRQTAASVEDQEVANTTFVVVNIVFEQMLEQDQTFSESIVYLLVEDNDGWSVYKRI